jgi:hypothetical protein
MQQLSEIKSQKIALLLPTQMENGRVGGKVLLDFTAVLALRGPVRVLDAGNRFDPYRVTRAIRRRTSRLDPVMRRIYVARAFTCYQVVTLLQETPPTPAPHLVFDLLATFSDQAVTTAESRRLLQMAIEQLLRLRRQAPVIISVHSEPSGQRAGLLRLLAGTADLVLQPDAPTRSALEKLLWAARS